MTAFLLAVWHSVWELMTLLFAIVIVYGGILAVFVPLALAIERIWPLKAKGPPKRKA